MKPVSASQNGKLFVREVGTLVFLPEHFDEVDCTVYSLLPGGGFKGEIGIRGPFRYRGKLEEVTRHDNLEKCLIRLGIGTERATRTWSPPKGLVVFLRSRFAISASLPNR